MERRYAVLTTESHLTAHAETGFHHFADALVAEHLSESPGQAVAQYVEYLEEHDLVGYAVARFEFTMRSGGGELGHGESEGGRVGMKDGIGDEFIDGGEGGSGDGAGRFGRTHDFEKGMQERESVEIAQIYVS